MVDLRDGGEVSARDIMRMMLMAVTHGCKVEFFSLMPQTSWDNYLGILSALFYTLDETNQSRYGEAYKELEKILWNIPERGGDPSEILASLKEVARRYDVEYFFQSLPEQRVHDSDDVSVRVASNLEQRQAYDVFISKESTDLSYAKELFFFLERSGIKTFLSEESIAKEGDADFQEVIERALASTRHLIVLGSSTRSFESDWVKAEWRAFLAEKRAGRKRGNLLTVRVGDIDVGNLPLALRSFHSLTWNDQVFDEIKSFVKGNPNPSN